MQRLPYALLIYLMHWRRRPGEKKNFFYQASDTQQKWYSFL